MGKKPPKKTNGDSDDQYRLFAIDDVCANISERTGRLAVEWAYASKDTVYGHTFIPNGKHVDSVSQFVRAFDHEEIWPLDEYVDLEFLGFGRRHRAVSGPVEVENEAEVGVLSIIDLNHQLPLDITI
jgi:hypothetical protein